MKKFALLFAAIIMSFTFVAQTTAQAGAVSAPGLLTEAIVDRAAGGLVHKTHGAHCSVKYGYVRRLGYRARHRHPLVCRRYRSSSLHRRCRYKYGYGWRYKRCMRRSW